MSRPPSALIPLALGAVLTLAGGDSARADGDLRAPAILVVGTTPLPGIGRLASEIPANVQAVDGRALGEAHSLNLPEFLARRLPGVSVNEIQGNPFQPDLNYRGFTASPLLGTPQGLSVFLDGVRMNEPFGDVVNWDLIPRAAIADLVLMPGSNPLYGLNTLGGALAIRTKGGDTHPGTVLETYGGAFGRRGGSLEHGGRAGEWSWFAAAEGMAEDGWRDRSPSRLGQLFGKLAWTRGGTDLALTLAHASTDLTGNGLVPESLHRQRRQAVFTHPDNTRNRMALASLSGSHWISDGDKLSGTVYLRRTRTRTLNGDVNDEYEDEYALDPTFDESGANNRTSTRQEAAGLGLQWSRIAGDHQFALGISHDRSRARFRQTVQEGELDGSRGVEPDGGEQLENSLVGHTRTSSIHFTDTVALAPTVKLTGSLRFNHTRVINQDQLGTALNGDFTYRKLNPALGLTWQAAPALTVYGGLSQGNRAPSPIELGCADPANPCSLPNAMAADPFLEQVVARTLELGLRGRLAGGARWHAGAFRTQSQDDILFIGTGTNSSRGYFTNFGRTRRDGVELGLDGESGAFDWRINYTWLRATFRSGACLLAENNRTAGQDAACAADEIRVAPGDRLPGLPAHNLKLAVAWRATQALRLGADLAAHSGQYVRGNENNRHGAGGRTPGYALVNLRADLDLGRGWGLFGKVDNLFDRRYSTGGALAENPFDPAGAFRPDPAAWTSETFLAPGAPRAAWIGLRYRFQP